MGANFLKNDAMELVQSVKPQVQTGDGTLTGAAVDRNAYLEQYQDAKVLVNIGELTSDGTVSITVTVQESDSSGSGYTTITDTEVIEEASYVTTSENLAYEFGLRLHQTKRYVRAIVVIDFTAGTSPTQAIAVSFLLINPRWNPAESNA